MSRLLVTGIFPFRTEDLQGYAGHDVTLLSSVPAGWPEQIVEHRPGMREHRIPRGPEYARQYASLGDSPCDKHRIAIARSAPGDEAFRRAFFRHAAQCDAIVHTSSTLFGIDERCGADGKPRVYDAAAGLEYIQACTSDPQGPFSHDAFEVHTLESRLVAASSLVVARDGAAFGRWYDCPPERLAAKLPEEYRFAPVVRAPRRRHIVILNDYRIDMQGGGGHVRLRELYHCAAEHCLAFTLVCLSDALERRDTALAPHFRQIAVPKTADHRQLEASVNSLHEGSAADVISLVCCADNEELEREFRAATITADAVVFEHVYLCPLLRLVPPGVPVVYGAQNVESVMKEKILGPHPQGHDLLEAVRTAEAELAHRADAVICVAQEDAAWFEGQTRGPIHVVENGVAIREPGRAADRHGALFIGSGHGPNVEALEFLLTHVAPAIRDVPFFILGSVCEAVPATIPVPPNVSLLGVVAEAQKAELLRTAAVGLNPMFSGGGSNLKLPEYFAARLPVVSTAFGTRGFDVADGVHLRTAEADRFAESVLAMLGDAAERERLSEAAYQYACERISWPVLGRKLREILGHLLPLSPRAIALREEADRIVAGEGDREVGFPTPRAYCAEDWPVPPDGPLTRFVQSREFADEDAALRSCTPPCPELDRLVSLYGGFSDAVVVRGGPRSALRRAARLLHTAGVPVILEPVFDAGALRDHWLGWYDVLRTAEVRDTDPSHAAVLEELGVRRQP